MNTMFAIFDLGGGQILLILALILIFFGAKRIPDLARGLGQGIKEFKKATREVSDEINNASENTPPAQPKQVSSSVPQSQAAAPAPSTESKP
jgi:sec-independent protein translocase protein TatA